MQINGKEYRLVPVEPTEKMMDALEAISDDWSRTTWKEAWDAALAAAPTPPEAAAAQAGAEVPDAHSLYLELSGIDEDLKHGGVGAFDQTCWDTLRRVMHALGVVPPEAAQALAPDELADLCETWLQSGGASNIVDAYEAGFREAEARLFGIAVTNTRYAARYRFLRDFPATYLPEGDLRVWMANRPFDMNGPRGLDALCDAGIAAGGEDG